MSAFLDWTLADVASATGGTVVGGASTTVVAVGTDSRNVEPGELFVAVRGDRYDGHDFVAAAISAGAAAAMLEVGRSPATPRVEVDDTLVALRDLAVRRRGQIAAPVVAVTGSTGKTSTKDLLAGALPAAWASPRSFNNEVGVPLTVLGTPLDAGHVVVEVGSRGAGNITWLMPAVRPDVAVITNLGVVHLETFGTPEALADAKWELVEGLGGDGVAVLPHDEPRLRRSHNGSTLTFGMGPGPDVAVEDLRLDPWGAPSFVLATPQGRLPVTLRLTGAHQARNAAAAAAAALACGVDPARIVRGLGEAVAAPWRMEIHRGAVTVVNDAYNANPDSMAAALDTVAGLAGRHVAVLGRMAELGDVEAAEHRRIGAMAAQAGYAAVIVVGDDPGFADGAGRIARSVPDQASALRVLAGFLREGDVVLVKASRAVGLEGLACELVKEHGS
ncbi:MAG TPA: UDP-N-acetylmuramoyl-tripeptide--D-alanyl-D-alanine ligase [Acidimicrobiia bacterium]